MNQVLNGRLRWTESDTVWAAITLRIGRTHCTAS